jgi:hypothetical protein
MPERKRRKSRGKCLVWRGISTCNRLAQRLLAKGIFVVQDGDGAKAFTPLTTPPPRPDLVSIRDSIAAATHLLQTFRLHLE